MFEDAKVELGKDNNITDISTMGSIDSNKQKIETAFSNTFMNDKIYDPTKINKDDVKNAIEANGQLENFKKNGNIKDLDFSLKTLAQYVINNQKSTNPNVSFEDSNINDWDFIVGCNANGVLNFLKITPDVGNSYQTKDVEAYIKEAVNAVFANKEQGIKDSACKTIYQALTKLAILMDKQKAIQMNYLANEANNPENGKLKPNVTQTKDINWKVLSPEADNKLK